MNVNSMGYNELTTSLAMNLSEETVAKVCKYSGDLHCKKPTDLSEAQSDRRFGQFNFQHHIMVIEFRLDGHSSSSG